LKTLSAPLVLKHPSLDLGDDHERDQGDVTGKVGIVEGAEGMIFEDV
jgi:hypothetical protein